MAALFSWTCFPGFVRTLGILPIQRFLFGADHESFDVMYSSGFVAAPIIASGIGHYLLHHFIIGPNSKFKVQMSDFAVYAIIAIADLSLGLIDGSLLKRPERPLLAQVP